MSEASPEAAPSRLSPTAWAALAGLCWGLSAPGWSGPLWLLAGGACAARSVEGRPVRDALRGALAGLWWFALAAAWVPDALTTHGASPRWALALLVAQALPVALPWGLASLLHRRVDPSLAWGLAWLVATEPMAHLQAVPTPLAVQVTGVPLLLWPAAVGGSALLSAAGAAAGAGMPRPQGGVLLGLWALVGVLWIDQPTIGRTVRVAVVQPDTTAATRGRSDLTEAHVTRLLTLVMQAGDAGAALVLGPEGAWPLRADDPDLARAWGGLPPTVIGVAAERATGGPNRLLAIDGAAVVGTFDKRHLVPVLERTWLGLGADVFTPGTTPRALALAGVPLAPLVCYEDMLPAALREVEHATLLLAPSSDLDLDVGPGAAWHLAASRLAAASLGLPLLRATPSGISAIVDDAGRVLKRLDVDTRRTDDAPGRLLVADVVLPERRARGPDRAPWLGGLALLVTLTLRTRPTRPGSR